MPCPEGSSLALAFISMVIMMMPLFIIVVFILLKCAHGSEHHAKKSKRVFGQIKREFINFWFVWMIVHSYHLTCFALPHIYFLGTTVLISFVQVVGSLVPVLDGVPWPRNFAQLSLPLNVANFDLMGLLSSTQCRLAVIFHHQFIVHMAMPPMLCGTIITAYYVTNLVKRPGSPRIRDHRWAEVAKCVILLSSILYPGLCTRIFNVFKCSSVFRAAKASWLETT